ncbi:DUF21 domain-containing protein [Camellia lanceoleosa]|uniref:DUF21 domain-containing protein n=1 Tax=Camellia lanceoleosa TaxID=1840588 RepID=A0ACC0FW61_9ERIC|nr:DUF21 domain-containing protein [Camellia lanceoleosa]
MVVEYKCCGSEFFIHILIIGFLVLFAGLMSGLTLGLMSISLVDLEVLAKSGTPKDRKHAAVAPFVRVLVWICFPVAYPISKLLDFLLGHGHVALSHRAELKTLVDLHDNELTEKTASDAMTPISDTFAVDINAKLDRELMNLILEKGYSRVPVYYEQPTNIIGLVLVKNLLTIHPEDEVPVKSVTICRIPRFLSNTVDQV